MLLALGSLAGGLGLFLLGVSMITDGLKLAVGPSLRSVLARSTRTTWHGVVSGFVLTGMVQSSSAVTIATIGFVNAGLLGIKQALTIVLGATVGTTTTSWLVAIVGFNFSISTIALPLIGAGMLLRLAGPSHRAGAFGEALAGFGLFFIGIDFLREAFDTLSADIDLIALAPDGLVGIVAFVGVGIVMTLLTQSSSASIALTLTAVSGGLATFPMAAAAVVGATIGTTSTSALAVIGATSNAKRVAAGHVIINSTNALVGVLMLPGLIWLYHNYEWVGDNITLSLAIFHTSLNGVGMLLQCSVVSSTAGWLSRRFRTKAEDLGRPQYLDSNVLASPGLALDAFLLELQRMANLTRQHAIAALSSEGKPARELEQQHEGLRQLARAVENAVTRLETERLNKGVTAQLPMVLRISNYIDEAVAHAQENAESDADAEYLLRTPVRDKVAKYQADVLKLIEDCDPNAADYDVVGMDQRYQELREQWRALKSYLLEASVAGLVPMYRMSPAIDSLRAMLRVAERSTRIAARLTEFATHLPAVLDPEQIAEMTTDESFVDPEVMADPDAENGPHQMAADDVDATTGQGALSASTTDNPHQQSPTDDGPGDTLSGGSGTDRVSSDIETAVNPYPPAPTESMSSSAEPANGSDESVASEEEKDRN